MYKLTENHAWYGDRRVPFSLLAEHDAANAGIPLTIESAADLDLEAIAEELNRTVFNRVSRAHRRSRTARLKMGREAWQLEVRETTPAKAAALNEQLKADGLEQHGPFTAQIYIAGNGISLRYELATCDSCSEPLEDNFHADGVCGTCHDIATTKLGYHASI